MFRAALIPVLAVLALTACGSNGSSNSNTGAGAAGGHVNGTPQKPINVTDKAECRNGRPATSVDGVWRTDFNAGEFTFSMYFEFDRNQLTLTNECHFRGDQLTVSVSSPYSDDGSYLQIHRSAENSVSRSTGGSNFDCNVSMKASTMAYRMEGSCLVFTDPASSQELTLVRAN